MKLIHYLFIFIITLYAIPDLSAQDFEQWKQEQERQYQEFKDERDAAFLNMLQEAWEWMNVTAPSEHFEKPKPEIIPEAEISETPDHFPDFRNLPPVDIRKRTPFLESFSPPVIPMPTLNTNNLPPGVVKATFDYFSIDVPYVYLPNERIRLSAPPSQNTIMNYWKDMSKSNYEIQTNRIMELQAAHRLNDWGLLKATQKMGRDLYGNSDNEINLFTWFIMTKLGYDVKVAFNQTRIFILFPFDRRLFNIPLIAIDGKRYYTIQLGIQTERPGALISYKGSYPEADKKISLRSEELPILPEANRDKEVRFYWDSQLYTFSVPFNYNVIDYFKSFPSTELDIYVNAGISKKTSEALLKNLGGIIDGYSEPEAVNILLRFVQTSFDYKTDTEQFGYQKYMIPEEIFYYPYSDCDDRTVLLAFLVRELLGLPAVGLRYPNHLALAVQLTDRPIGDSVHYKGSNYTVADPTYINATIGMTMPQFRNVQPEIIEI